MHRPEPLWSSLAIPWQCAIEEAWQAYCAGSIAIGAVITDTSGQIIVSGHNGVVAENGGYHPLKHAELAVLNAFDYERYDPPFDYCLYTTLEPCPLCMGAFYMSGLRELHCAARDPHAGSTNLLGATPYLGQKPIRVFHPEDELLELLLSGLLIAPLIAGGATVDHPLLRKYNQQMPDALRFGSLLAASRMLDDLRPQKSPAHEVISHFEQLYHNSFRDADVS